jgi:hypothetical protein
MEHVDIIVAIGALLAGIFGTDQVYRRRNGRKKIPENCRSELCREHDRKIAVLEADVRAILTTVERVDRQLEYLGTQKEK